MIRKYIEDLIGKREFNAENCRNHQQSELEKKASVVAEDIKAYINFKVSNTNEKAIIYSLSNSDPKAMELVKDYFKERGFKVFETKFQEELGDAEFLVISWLL